MTFSQPQLDHFFRTHPIEHHLSEWGAPIGQLSRLIPCLLIRQLKQTCLWVHDDQQYQIYPTYWKDLGNDLKKIYFLYEAEPFKNLRTPLKQAEFPIIVFDLKGFVTAANMSYLAAYARQRKITIFLLRKFFLSPRQGNPFARYRFNCSYSLSKNSFQLQTVKGHHQVIQLPAQEILHD